MRDLVIYGTMLKVANLYVCWDSYKATFYLGKKCNSEIFSEGPFIRFIFDIEKMRDKLTKRAYLALSLFPTAKRVYATEDNS